MTQEDPLKASDCLKKEATLSLKSWGFVFAKKLHFSYSDTFESALVAVTLSEK